MAEPLQRFFDINGKDKEADAIKICIEILYDIESEEGRKRVVDYLRDRFGQEAEEDGS